MNRFTLFGALQYDQTLFDDFVLPESYDRQILIDEIIKECGDLKPYYQNPVWLKRNINNWFERMYFSFDKMMAAIKSEFNPIENYDRYEDRHTSESESSSESSAGSLSENGSTSSSSYNSESTLHDVSAYNESDYSPADRNRIAGKDSGKETRSNKSDTSSNRNTTMFHQFDEDAHIHGNIGVTRADEMIRSVIKMYEEIDVYRIVARMFEKEFMIQVY